MSDAHRHIRPGDTVEVRRVNRDGSGNVNEVWCSARVLALGYAGVLEVKFPSGEDRAVAAPDWRRPCG